jgi:uncharacterized membrane-anchored protein YitT (DUF2179 family)
MLKHAIFKCFCFGITLKCINFVLYIFYFNRLMKHFGIVFLSLTISTIVLIHVVIPHHHHGDLLCFRNHIENCSTHHDEHEKNAGHHDCTSHEYPGEGVSCLFEQILLPNNQNEKNEHHWDVFCPYHYNNHLIQSVLLAFNYEFYIPDEGAGIDNPLPYLITYHSINASRISGLRAPPIV